MSDEGVNLQDATLVVDYDLNWNPVRLMQRIGRVDRRHQTRAATRGDVPSSLHIPSGCRFRTRCADAEERCAGEDPALRPVAPNQEAACHVLPFHGSA